MRRANKRRCFFGRARSTLRAFLALALDSCIMASTQVMHLRPERHKTTRRRNQMNMKRAALVLSGLGLAAALALYAAVVAAQTAATPTPKLGSSLVGKLEGPTIVLDVKAY